MNCNSRVDPRIEGRAYSAPYADKNGAMAIDKRTTRLGVLALVSMLLIGALGTRLWFLQGVEAATFQAKVSAAKLREVLIPPERGRIFDAKGRILADNQRILTVAIDWSVIKKPKNRQALFERLSGPLKVPVIDLQRRYDPCFGEPTIPKCTKGQRYSTLLPLPLKEDVDEDTVTYLKERSEDFPGIQIVEQWKRVYPYAPLASHVVGYLGPITKETKKQYEDKNYNTNELVGAYGVELSMEDQLHGSWGKEVFEVDAAGGIVAELVDQHVDPIAGRDIQLTIDLDIQQYAEQALGDQAQAASPAAHRHPRSRHRRPQPDRSEDSRRQPPRVRELEGVRHAGVDPVQGPGRFGRRRGQLQRADPRDGQLSAIRQPVDGGGQRRPSSISSSARRSIRTRARPTPTSPCSSTAPCRAATTSGRSIKPFVAWSAMHSGVIGPNEVYVDKGSYVLESIPKDVCASGVRCEFKNATNVRTQTSSSYGPVTVADALAVSSDAFFYRLGEKFWEIDEHNASVDPALKGKSTLEGRPRAFRLRLRERRAVAVRMARAFSVPVAAADSSAGW